MGEQKEEDLYHNFSRKDFQGLCKKYGLPANKSNSEMATSLILYLEKKNLNSRAIWEGTRSDFVASGMRELQAGVKMNSTDDHKKDCEPIASHKGSGNYRYNNHRDAQQNDLKKCKGSASSDKASEDVGKLTQLHTESNSGAGIQENTFSSVVSSSAVAPSPTLTYDVCCEDGIQLYVDLNLSSSDWVENLKAGVHVCHHVHKPISPSIHQDIDLQCSKQNNGSVIMDPSKEADNGKLEVGSYPTNVVALTDEPDGLKDLSRTMNSLDNSREELAILSSKLESSTPGKLPGMESSRREEALAADSGSNEVMQTGISCNFKGNFVTSDPEGSGLQVDPDANTGYGICEKTFLQQTNGSLDAGLKCSELSTTVCLEIQTSTSVTLNEDFKNSPSDLAKELKHSEVEKSVQTLMTDELQLQPVQAVDQSKYVSYSPLMNNHSLDLSDVKSKMEPQQVVSEKACLASSLRKTDGKIREAQTHSAEPENAAFPRIQEASTGTDEEQKKDAALHSCCNGGPFDLVVPEQNGGDYYISTELNEDNICRIPSAADAGQLGIRGPGNGSEGLKSLKHEDQLGIQCNRPVGSESNGELKKKRHNGNEGQSKFVNTEAKILRSSKQFVGDVHSKRRRSSRLFTKVLMSLGMNSWSYLCYE